MPIDIHNSTYVCASYIANYGNFRFFSCTSRKHFIGRLAINY